MKSITYTFVILLIIVSACEDVAQSSFEEKPPVVEGFLFAGQPVKDITIKQVSSFGSDEETIFINDLEVSIIHNNTSFLLTSNPDKPGNYTYSGQGLDVEIGETYSISFNFEGKAVTGSTTIPPKPVNFVANTNTLEVPQINTLQDLLDFRNNESNTITVEWDNPNSDFYFLVIENLEENPEAIDPNGVINQNFEFTSTPVTNDFFTLRPLVHFVQFGRHRVVLHRINEEYAFLFESVEDLNSRDLNEPFSNITNGEGIFSGFAGDTLFFDIQQR